MEPELYDGDFYVHYPSWIIVHKNSIVATGEQLKLTGQPEFLMIGDDANDKSFPVFSDDDLAVRFLEASNLQAFAAVAAENPQTLLAFLGAVNGKPASHVVFDPPKTSGWERRVWPIEYVIKRLKNDPGLQ